MVLLWAVLTVLPFMNLGDASIQSNLQGIQIWGVLRSTSIQKTWDLPWNQIGALDTGRVWYL